MDTAKVRAEFIAWLTEENHKPSDDGAVGGNCAQGPTTWYGGENGAAYAGAMVVTMQGHNGLLNGTLVALRASVASLFGPLGVGVFAEAELARAEGGIGPVRIALHLNANTALGVRNGGLEVSLVGFGASVGAKLSVSLPVCTAGIGR